MMNSATAQILGTDSNDTIKPGQQSLGVSGIIDPSLTSDDVIDAKLGRDSIDGGEGNDVIIKLFDVNAGGTLLSGGNGNDLFLLTSQRGFSFPFSAGDTVDGGLGVDTVRTPFFDLAFLQVDEVERLELAGISFSADQFEDLKSIEIIFDPSTIAPPFSIDVLRISLDGSGEFDLGALDFRSTNGELVPVDVSVDGEGVSLVAGTILDDRLRGGNGNDTLFGESGDDTITNLGGADIVFGGSGADLVTDNGPANDSVFGGSGLDTCYGGGGADRVSGGKGRDWLFGGDEIFGEFEDDNISDADVLVGGSGRDRLFGDVGADMLRGGKGLDRLTGGGGNDVFVVGFNAYAEFDIILDFEVGDRIKVSGADPTTVDVSFVEPGSGLVSGTLLRFFTQTGDVASIFLKRFDLGPIQLDDIL